MKLSKYSKGQMLVVMTLVIATLLGVMALGTDVGVMYYQWGLLQKGADAAALAGAAYLNDASTGVTLASTSVNANCTGYSDDAKKAACTYVLNNGLASDTNSMTINEPGQNMPAGAATPNIQVLVKKNNQPYFFGKIIGLNTYNVSAVAAANSDRTVSGAQGVFPMGMDCAYPCDLSKMLPGQSVPFNIKFTPTIGGAPGNWQWVNVGTGASSLGNAVTNGVPGTLYVGGTIGTATGNKGDSGPVNSAFNQRMNSCPAITDPCNGGSTTNIPPNDPCLVTVPAVDFAGCTGSCNVTIEGFAQVYIEPTSSSKSNGSTGGTQISACFVKMLDVNAVAGGSSAPALGPTTPPMLIQ